MVIFIDNNLTLIILAAIAAIAPTILGIATLIQGIRTHRTFNSKMDKMLELTAKSSFAEGAKYQKDAQNQPTKE